MNRNLVQRLPSESAVWNAYDNVYGDVHGWAVRKIFEVSFKAAPEATTIFRQMQPEIVKELEAGGGRGLRGGGAGEGKGECGIEGGDGSDGSGEEKSGGAKWWNNFTSEVERNVDLLKQKVAKKNGSSVSDDDDDDETVKTEAASNNGAGDTCPPGAGETVDEMGQDAATDKAVIDRSVLEASLSQMSRFINVAEPVLNHLEKDLIEAYNLRDMTRV